MQNKIFEIISNNNGSISSIDLAKICIGDKKDTHSNFMKKAKQVLGGGIVNFYDTYIHPQNGQRYTTLMLPKREACLMAMSYSYELQAVIFDAYELYKDTLQKIAESASNPRELAINALHTDFIDYIKKDGVKVGAWFRKFYEISSHPWEAHESIMNFYTANATLFDKQGKESFFKTYESMNSTLRKEHRKSDNFETQIHILYNMVEKQIFKKQRYLSRRKKTVAENKLFSRIKS